VKLIVYGTDGSVEARAALDYAVELAAETHATIAVVSVHPHHQPLRATRGGSVDVVEVDAPGGAQHLADEAASAIRDKGVDATAVTLFGDPADAIAEYAATNKADLIIVGSRGLGALSSAIYGSVSRALVKRSGIPVTVINHRTAQPAV
jgi:nucleotide-binding universal stress UspA family protein